MKDLKHLLYFENLLQEAHNDLVAQAQNEGKICVAYACENTPEPLLNLPGAFSTRLRAPRTGSMEMATLSVRVQPRTAGACHRGRLQLRRLHDHAGRLLDDEPRRREHGAAQDHGQEQAEVLLRVHGDPDEGRRQRSESVCAPVPQPHPHAAARALRHRRVGRGHPQRRRRAQPCVRAHPRHR